MARKEALSAALCLAFAAFAAPVASAAPVEEAPAAAIWVNSTVTIVTNFGTIVAMLYDQGAPITVGNFINLSTSGFYDGIKFHRIVDDFVIQTGDPNTRDSNPYNDGMGGSSETIPLEVSEELTHVDGALGMARSQDPNSASSQFYICDGAQHGLDGDYAVFGVVVEGMEVVREIASQPVWGLKRPALQQQPINDIIMEQVTASYGYEQTVEQRPGGGGVLEDLVAFGGPGGEVAASVVVVLAVALLAALCVASFRRKAWRILRSYGYDVRRARPAKSGLLRARNLTRGLRSGVRRSYSVARMGLPRRR